LSGMFGDVPLTDVLILLIGLRLAAAAGAWRARTAGHRAAAAGLTRRAAAAGDWAWTRAV
jgi:hypothetical protein